MAGLSSIKKKNTSNYDWSLGSSDMSLEGELKSNGQLLKRTIIANEDWKAIWMQMTLALMIDGGG